MELLPDLIKDCFEVPAHLRVGDPDDTPALLGEPPIAASVAFGIHVGASVDFDGEAFSNAGEVGDVRADRVLPTKANAEFAFAQAPPKERLGGGGVAAHGSGALDLHRVVSLHALELSQRSDRVSAGLELLCRPLCGLAAASPPLPRGREAPPLPWEREGVGGGVELWCCSLCGLTAAAPPPRGSGKFV